MRRGGGACTGVEMVAEAALLTFFVIAGNTLLRSLVNAINRIPFNERALEATCEVRLATDPASVPVARGLLLQQLEAASYPVGDVKVVQRGEGVAELVATLVSTAVNPRGSTRSWPASAASPASAMPAGMPAPAPRARFRSRSRAGLRLPPTASWWRITSAMTTDKNVSAKAGSRRAVSARARRRAIWRPSRAGSRRGPRRRPPGAELPVTMLLHSRARPVIERGGEPASYWATTAVATFWPGTRPSASSCLCCSGAGVLARVGIQDRVRDDDVVALDDHGAAADLEAFEARAVIVRADAHARDEGLPEIVLVRVDEGPRKAQLHADHVAGAAVAAVGIIVAQHVGGPAVDERLADLVGADRELAGIVALLEGF